MLDLLMAWCWAPASPPSHKLDKQGHEASRRIQLGPVYTENLQVDVVGTTITTKGSNKFTVYIIVVGVDGVKSTVLRRYSQFFQLNVQVRRGCLRLRSHRDFLAIATIRLHSKLPRTCAFQQPK
ncbi:hypothetical protein AC1031_020108 [Aphanomyces cochlioides]|nr:hypothetical protein AC1031_020108 [Aphanomyces cochlioides]